MAVDRDNLVQTHRSQVLPFAAQNYLFLFFFLPRSEIFLELTVKEHLGCILIYMNVIVIKFSHPCIFRDLGTAAPAGQFTFTALKPCRLVEG